jgi:diguanylate cyclase (GGDEF)-like protein/PAS domain S-box-containing protein
MAGSGRGMPFGRFLRAGGWPVGYAILAALATTWLVYSLLSPVTSQVLRSVPGLIAALVWLRAAKRTAGTPHLRPPARRFWRTVEHAAWIGAAGPIWGMIEGVWPRVPHATAIYIAITGTSLAMIVWALLRVPLGAHGLRERIRSLLDVAVVTLASALFIWHFLFERMSGPINGATAMGPALMFIGELVCLVGIVKVDSATSVIDSVSLRLIGLGMLVNAVVGFVAPVITGHSTLDVMRYGLPLARVLIAAAARRQSWVTERGSTIAATTERASYSALPYAAVAAVDALLLTSLHDSRDSLTVIAAGAVALTAIVIFRQLVAFRDNGRLLGELARSERRFRSLVQYNTDVILIVDTAGRITYASPGVQQLTGRPAPDWIGRISRDHLHPDDLAHVERLWTGKQNESGAMVTYQGRVRHSDGSWRWAEITRTNLFDDPAVNGMVVNLHDITESYAYQQQLSHQAGHDSLTELANRSLFNDQLRLALRRSTGDLSLILIDLDDFKSVNDTLGHHAGDALLVEVAERLRRAVRGHDLVARLGGDEFAVLLPDTAGTEVDLVAERILASIQESVMIEGHELLIQASLGIANLQPGIDASRLMRHADIAMYEAKDAGTGCFVTYTPNMKRNTSPRAQIAAELRVALQSGQFEVHYQPVVDLPSGRMVGAEALVRWRHPERGLVSPGEFIPIAEETGLVIPIGRFVLAEACRQVAHWLAEDPDRAPQSISVNVSAYQLRDRDVARDVSEVLGRTGLPPHRLTIEVTETAVLRNPAAAASAVAALHDVGVRISLDDFGTGHSTLSLLHTFTVDELKLDRSFLPTETNNNIAMAVQHLAEGLGLDVIAEGVETEKQAADLTALGYRKAQGFYFARPMAAADLELWQGQRSGALVPEPATAVPGGREPGR